MIFSLIFFRTYSKQRRPPPPIGVRVWVNGPFLLRESEKMRDCVMREISFLCAWWRKNPFIVIVGAPIVVAWKRKKSVHDCVKLEKMISLHDCMNVNKKVPACVIGHRPPPLPGGASTTLRTNNLHRLLRVRPLFHKVVFLIGKKRGEKPVCAEFPGLEKSSNIWTAHSFCCL